MSKLYRGPSIDASYQVSVHLTRVSEEKIKMWKVNGRQTTDDKWWQKLTLPLAMWDKNENVKKKVTPDNNWWQVILKSIGQMS
jgi:hypothetical protein